MLSNPSSFFLARRSSPYVVLRELWQPGTLILLSLFRNSSFFSQDGFEWLVFFFSSVREFFTDRVRSLRLPFCRVFFPDRRFSSPLSRRPMTSGLPSSRIAAMPLSSINSARSAFFFFLLQGPFSRDKANPSPFPPFPRQFGAVDLLDPLLLPEPLFQERIVSPPSRVYFFTDKGPTKTLLFSSYFFFFSFFLPPPFFKEHYIFLKKPHISACIVRFLNRIALPFKTSLRATSFKVPGSRR